MIDASKLQIYKNSFDRLAIKSVYEDFPPNFTMDVNGWSFPNDMEDVFLSVELDQDEIETLRKNNLLKSLKRIDDKRYQVKQLKTIDIEISPDDTVDKMNQLKERAAQGEFSKKGIPDIERIQTAFSLLYQNSCTQRCPHCFNQEDSFYVTRILNNQRLMKWKEIFQYLKTAKKYGLRSVKFLGIGEIFKNPNLFEILDDLRNEGLLFCIFTKGAVLGDNQLAKECGYEGIKTAEDLVKKLSTYSNLSILLGANSFLPEKQDQMVGCGIDGGIKNYTQKRNNALKLLVKYGFNDPLFGKRLALIATPVTPLVSDEIIEMYLWGAKRNITVITIPTMVSGKGCTELEWLFNEFEQNSALVNRYDPQRTLNREERYTEWVIDFYTDIYRTAIDNRILKLENVLSERGISGYAGAAYCQQKHNGLYLRLPGTIQECPGRSYGAVIENDIREKGLLCSWVGSKNYSRDSNCRSLCSVKMKKLTKDDVEMCSCCEVYENVGSMPTVLESRVRSNLKMIYSVQ